MEASHPAPQKVPFYLSRLKPLMAGFVRLAPVGAPMGLLTVRGRTSGRDRTTPVAIFEHDGERYVFGTFGVTQWVRNLRVAGEAVLARGRRRTRVAATELTAEEAGPVLRGVLAPYLATPMRLVLQRYYAASTDGSVHDYIELAQRHPVFRLREVATL